MARKILFFFISVAIIATLFGCHSGGHSPFANVGKNNIVVAPPAVVDANGKFDDIVFNHTADNIGQTKITCENGTLQEGVVVEVKEVKTTTTALNQNQNVYIYTIDAYKETATGDRTYVQSLEKPLTITLPTQHLGETGICYVGVRYSENDPWQYRRVSEDGTVTLNARLAIASTNQLKKEYGCEFYRMGIQIALFLYKESETKPEETTKLVSVDKITATSTADVTTEEGAYIEDLQLAISLEGENIGDINPADIIVKVTYRSDSETPAEIKVNSQPVTQKTVKDDSVVKGKGSYAHSFELPTVNSFSNSDSLKAKLDYVFALKGITLSAFQNEFLVELNGVIPDGLIKTFGYSEYFKFATKEKTKDSDTETDTDTNTGSGTDTNTGSETDTDTETETDTDTNTDTDTDTSITTYTLDLLKGKGIETVTGAGTYEAGTSVTASCTMQEGYEFANWTGDITTEHFIMPEENVTMTANATPIEYTISYIINGGEFAEGVTSPTVFTVESEGFSVPTPTKLNYNFKAWYDKNGNSIATIVPGTTGDKILTASYTPKFFDITYDLANGTLEEGKTNPASYSIESSLITLNNPTRDGYIFRGWTGTDIATGTATTTVKIPTGSTGNRSYTATWMKVDLIFDLGNGITLYMNKVTKDNTVWYAGVFEVTQAQYYAVMGTNPSSYKGDDSAESAPTTNPNRPVEQVSWNTIMQEETGFMAKINAKLAEQLNAKGISGYVFSLPSVEQWKYTCDAEGSNGYCKGEDEIQVTTNTLADYAWYTDNATTTHDVGTKKANYWGFYDMHGNVWEWCKDTTGNDKRAARGGSIGLGSTFCSSSNEFSSSPDSNSSDKGFRVFLVPDINNLTFDLGGGVTLKMRRCPAGTFTMGSPDTETGRSNDETQHQVTISKDFYMGIYVVTQAQYKAIMESNPSENKSEAENMLPVEKVSWDDIMNDSTGFIAKLNASLTAQLPTGYRFDLPTEAQWEYACRAGTTTSLNNGTNIVNAKSEDSNLNAVGWYYQNWGQSNFKTHTVGVKTPNAWGLYDMHGNVFEWCKDWYASDYYTTCGDCTDPQGPDSGSNRVHRGGGWGTKPLGCRSARRGSGSATNGGSDIGFRLALVAPAN